jgi:hypothetical protein
MLDLVYRLEHVFKIPVKSLSGGAYRAGKQAACQALAYPWPEIFVTTPLSSSWVISVRSLAVE